jgi:hypothetical protein
MALRLSRNCNAIRLQGSTHVFRTHDGLRGSETERFTAENRTAKWRIYDKIVMKKVRQETPLQDYLSRIGRPSTLSSLHMRQAYLQRSTIMARVGLYAEMLEDMRLALEVDSRSPLTQEEQNGFDVGGYRYHGKEGFWDSDFMQELKRLCGSPAGQEIGFQIAQQLYWHACYALRKGETREALRNLQSTLILLGVKGMASSVRYKAGLSKRRQTNGARAGERSPAEM